MGTGEFNAGGNPAMDWHPIQGGVEIFLVASCHGNRDKLRPDGPGSHADCTYLYLFFLRVYGPPSRSINTQKKNSSHLDLTLGQ